jgi:hypothetical protein
MLNINLKIEAKSMILKYGNLLELGKSKEGFLNLYQVFSLDTFLLPYKVQKLSKRAKRNLI